VTGLMLNERMNTQNCVFHVWLGVVRLTRDVQHEGTCRYSELEEQCIALYRNALVRIWIN